MDSNNEKSVKSADEVERLIGETEEKFQEILSRVLESKDESAHKVEGSIFRLLLALGLKLLQLFFANQNYGDCGSTLETPKGLANRGQTSDKSYLSIFGRVDVKRYLYHVDNETFAPLDLKLNLPKRRYSYFLSEWVNRLNINNPFGESVRWLKKFLGLSLSVSGVETISGESAKEVENYYSQCSESKIPPEEDEFTVIGFDGKGVPMIKKEAVKIRGRPRKGQKRQKKKEALVGLKYHIKADPREPAQIAENLVYPEKQSKTCEKRSKAKNIKYIASIKKAKRQVMREIFQKIEHESFDEKPLICLIDGAKSLRRAVKDVFKPIENKVIILDIIHVLEYVWRMAHVKHDEGSQQAKQYVYERLLLILEGKVQTYIDELSDENETGDWTPSQKKIFKKVITYLNNQKSLMKYDKYLSQGYPIGTGVIESACGHLVKERMELAGAKWSIDGAETILRLRSVVKSNEWEAYWAFYTEKSRINNSPFESLNFLNIK